MTRRLIPVLRALPPGCKVITRGRTTASRHAATTAAETLMPCDGTHVAVLQSDSPAGALYAPVRYGADDTR